MEALQSIRLPAAAPGQAAPAQQSAKPEMSGKNSFKEILSGVKAEIAQSSDLQRNLTEFENAVLKGKSFSARDILVFQIRASQFGVHVELLSKAVESGLSAVRKLQQSQ